MTKNEIDALDMEQLEERAAAIATEAETAEPETLDQIQEELDAIEERKNQIETEAAEKRAAMEAVLEEAKEIEKPEKKEERKMNSREVRALPEYVNAYAEYIKGNNNGEECRALLTTNAVIGSDEFGTIPVPTYVEDRIQAAWENDQIMSRVRRTFVRGNVRVGVEMAATGAVFHDEGGEAPDEEILTIALVDIVAKNAKKWIHVSDEAMALTGSEFLAYLYDEIEYQIVKAEAAKVLETINAAPTSGTTAPIVTKEDWAGDPWEIIEAAGSVVGEDLVVMANRATIAHYKAEVLQGQFAYDPFDGMTVIPTDSLPAYNDAGLNTGDPIVIVGDLQAIQANFPAGGEVTFKFDDLSEAEADLVKIVGKQLVGIGLVRTKAFAILKVGN